MTLFDRCDIGNCYWYPEIPGPAVYVLPCMEPVTHRYQAPGMADGHWSHRCQKHVTWLSAPGLVIEPIDRNAP
jgi:hypothetical protein